jgi:hypothetical protein
VKEYMKQMYVAIKIIFPVNLFNLYGCFGQQIDVSASAHSV